MHKRRESFAASAALTAVLIAAGLASLDCAGSHEPAATPEAAATFAAEANETLLDLAVRSERAGWVQSNFITHDTEILAAQAQEAGISKAVELANEATRFDGLELAPEVRRQLDLLKLAVTMPAPRDPALTRELTQIATGMESNYGTGKYCPEGGDCMDLTAMSRIMAQERDAARLQEIWEGWHATAPTIRDDYRRFVELSNQGAQELGFADTGSFWRSKYDMAPDDFAAEMDRLWLQVKPLYDALHCHVRAALAERYGADVVPATGPLPAHLLGNMWAQSWNNIYDLVAPGSADPGYDLSELLKARGLDAVEMVRYGERFFSSLGFDPLPETFWERSLFTKPRDREVVCHASAWDVDQVADLRIKMCIDITAEDFQTIHHELGHNYYQRAYNQLPLLFRNSANDGFHEAVGDAVALSVTPRYLVDLGFIDEEPDASKDLGLLLMSALDKVAFLPFGLLVDKWRWQVFSGEISPEDYNQGWWDLRLKYQGIAPPSARDESQFDAGAKYHIPANTPYARYFLADILQFQFHRAMCEIAGYEGPLHRCSVYGSKEAGERLEAMLAMGASRPWPEALEALTGMPQMDATAILDYYAPLKTWLDDQNEGRTCGW